MDALHLLDAAENVSSGLRSGIDYRLRAASTLIFVAPPPFILFVPCSPSLVIRRNRTYANSIAGVSQTSSYHKISITADCYMIIPVNGSPYNPHEYESSKQNEKAIS